jgi:hypothetical protein
MYKKTVLTLTLVTAFLFNCGDNCKPEHKSVNNYLTCEKEVEIYSEVTNELLGLPEVDHLELVNYDQNDIRHSSKRHLDECDCIKPFGRDIKKFSSDNHPKKMRYELDRQALKYLYPLKGKRIKLMFFGSGLLLNELTIVSRLIQAGLDLDIYLMDFNYVLFKGADEKTHAMNSQLAQKINRQQVVEELNRSYENKLFPSSYEIYVAEQLNKKNNQENLDKKFSVLADNQLALKSFYTTVNSLNKKYQTKSQVHVLSNDTFTKINKKEFDAFFVIDAFFDISTFTKFMPCLESKNNVAKTFVFDLNKYQDNGYLAINNTSDKTKARLEIYNYECGKNFEKKTLVQKIVR